MSAISPAAPLDAVRTRLAVLSRNEALDATFLAASVVLGLYGFRPTYGQLGYLGGGVAGLLIGIAIAHVALRLGMPSLGTLATVIVTFFALGGVVVLRETALAGLVPTGHTLQTLVDSSVHGWRDLLTLLPPIGDAGPLLVIPYLLGMVAGVTGHLLASRTRSVLLPLASPLGVLAAGILFGIPQPASLVLQGTVLAPLLISWAAVRHSRRALVTIGSTRVAGRLLAAIGMLIVAAAAAKTISTHLPFAGSHERLVLRNHVDPPFDPTQFPSPLAAFENYVRPTKAGAPGLRDTALFTVRGLPAGARIRIATMDTWDGMAWNVTNGTTGSAGAFQRIGLRVPQTTHGTRAKVRVTITGYDDVWLPNPGATETIRFSGDRASDLASAFRYDLATGTGVVSSSTVKGLERGDSYVVDAVVPAKVTPQQLAGATPAGAATSFGISIPGALARAKAWIGGAGPSAYARLSALAAYMRSHGAYSAAPQVSRPGHGLKRMADFFTPPTLLVGDDEQYASAFAILANMLGYPSRVVLGASPEPDGTVKGADVHAWPEVDFAGGVGWVAFEVTPPKTQHPNPNPPIVQEINRTPNRVPPAAPEPPPAEQSEADTSKASGKGAQKNKRSGSTDRVFAVIVGAVRIAGPPIGGIAGILGGIVLLKALRRQRRRRRGGPAQRVSAGWRELVDLAVDLGAERPGRDTRRRTARRLGLPTLLPLAQSADAHSFGSADPDEVTAVRYWSEVDDARRELRSRLGRGRRLLAAVSLASLGAPRLRRPVAAADSSGGSA